MSAAAENTHHVLYPEALARDAQRPKWSVLIPSYNCAHYLELALESVLAQNLPPSEMEILVIDDASSDDPAGVVSRVGGDRVRFIEQDTNVGKIRNYETGILASRGHYIHQLHGDDRVRPGFYEALGEVLDRHPEAAAAFCRSLYIDAEGRWTGMTGMEAATSGVLPDFADRLALKQLIQTPAMVVRRSTYETLGCFDRRFDCMEDWEMWTRIAAHHPIAYVNEVLAEYRSHASNATSETFASGVALDTHRLLLSVTDTYLPAHMHIGRNAARRREHARFILASGRHLKAAAQRRKHAARALGLSRSPIVLREALRVLLSASRSRI